MNLFRTGLLLAATLGFVQTATAADMPRKAPDAPQLWSWTGLYTGIHAGWGWTNNSTASSVNTVLGVALPDNVASHDLSTDGPMVGLHLGYNWQLGSNWVLGIEGDFTGSGLRSASSTGSVSPVLGAPAPGNVQAMQRDVNWLATVRGRMGYAWGPAMIYVTGGGALANIDFNAVGADTITCAVPGGIGCALPASVNDTRAGWTAGGGYERMLALNWMVRLEYLYYRFDGITTSATVLAPACAGGGVCTSTFTYPHLDIHSVRVGASYKFGDPVAASGARAQVYAAAPADWTGFYTGLHAGWGWTNGASASSRLNGSTTPIALTSATHDLGADGPLFGGHLGYNWQVGPTWVVGIEGDFSGTGIRGKEATGSFSPFFGLPSPGIVHSVERDVNWLATARGRIGYTWGPSMIYATGGGAWASVDVKGNAGSTFACFAPGALGCSFPAEASKTMSGWTAGGGYETAVLQNWIARVEYLYYDLDGSTATAVIPAAGGCAFGTCTATYTAPDLNIHSVRVGMSYKFN
jgi:outer membrane immunogenic protein